MAVKARRVRGFNGCWDNSIDTSYRGIGGGGGGSPVKGSTAPTSITSIIATATATGVGCSGWSWSAYNGGFRSGSSLLRI